MKSPAQDCFSSMDLNAVPRLDKGGWTQDSYTCWQLCKNILFQNWKNAILIPNTTSNS